MMKTKETLKSVPKSAKNLKTRFTLLTPNKKTARSISKSFEVCKIHNRFIHKTSINEVGSFLNKEFESQIVIIDADSYPDRWVEMVRTLSQLQSVKGGGIVVLSSFGDNEILVKAKDAGANRFIIKPFDILGMYHLIHSLNGFEFQIVKTGDKVSGM